MTEEPSWLIRSGGRSQEESGVVRSSEEGQSVEVKSIAWPGLTSTPGEEVCGGGGGGAGGDPVSPIT
ncbi:unnamed protein product [Pleuronectes platessa]|uniref:Uncharacterized protein n=1 Tax=Pleuronectes platessa TaxID=8262 RepID=A0A9N7V421_PLEPL|nr:unnamed protein product [Pleuronectes platessa]